MSIGAAGLIFAEALYLAPGKAQGWTFYLTTWETIFEVVLRLVAAGLAGLVAGSLCAIILAPLVLIMKPHEKALQWITDGVLIIIAIVLGRDALNVLIQWSYTVASHRGLFDIAARAAFYVAFAAIALVPRARRSFLSNFEGLVSKKGARRVVFATLGGAVLLVLVEFGVGKAGREARASNASGRRPQSNILLITFDALTAEDMSLYGKSLPTTPRIDAFARDSTVFTNFYSASTFTTPCVAIVTTGLYPSQNRVQQLQGRICAKDAEQSVPHLLKEAGYGTGGFFSNPYAYYLARSVKGEYNFLPEPVFQGGATSFLWKATTPLHQDSGFGTRIEEYIDFATFWSVLTRQPDNLYERYRAVDSFAQAKDILRNLPDGFFLWIHVMSPHGPYIPGQQDLGRFYKGELREHPSDTQWKPHYAASQQGIIDEWHLRYDEFIATADRAFGDFMDEFQHDGRMQHTTVIVSADHGESFQGGIFQHGGAYQTRPVIHIPLIVHRPGQASGRTVTFVTDQTSLAPTILALAGLDKPKDMRGESLLPFIEGARGEAPNGLAFCQYFEMNSAFRPLHHGTVGVIDGKYQYLLDLDTQKGALRPLNEAQSWNLDRSSDNPERAQQLRSAIVARFPELHLTQ